MISDATGGDSLHEYCHFRTATVPMASTPVVYQLDIPTFTAAEPAIFAQFSKYLLNDTWLGYLNRPDDESTSDMLMTPKHVERARNAFEQWWEAAT
jgi:hypothetical protein